MAITRITPMLTKNTPPEDIVKMAIEVLGIPKMGADLARARKKIGDFRTSLENSSLGKFDLSRLLVGGGLIGPFLYSIESAIYAGGATALSAAVSLEQFDTSMMMVSQNIGEALLPAVTDVLDGLRPFLDGLAEIVKENPDLVKGLAAAALAFTVVTSVAIGAAAVFGLLTSPIGLVAAAIALAAGIIVANWGAISSFLMSQWIGMKTAAALVSRVVKAVFNWNPMETLASVWGAITAFFYGLWNEITISLRLAWDSIKWLFDWSPRAVLETAWAFVGEFFSGLWNEVNMRIGRAWDSIKSFFNWSPRAVLVAAWAFVGEFFSGLWSQAGSRLGQTWDSIKAQFDWSPMELIRGLWEPLSSYFEGLWSKLQELALPVMDVFKTLFDWSPLGMIMAHWEPITEWFSKWWERMQTIIAPFKELISGKISGLIEMITGDKEPDNRRVSFARDNGQQSAAQASSNLGQSSTSLLQQSATNNRAQLEGGFTVRFENAPAGMRADAPQSNQPNLLLTSRIGYRSLSLGGSHDSQLA